MVMRFHLDEHVDHIVARALRQRGVDATTTTDAGLLQAADADHVAFALRERRIIYTNDANFLQPSAHDELLRQAIADLEEPATSS